MPLKTHKGFTLVEVLVALTIAVVALTMLLQLYTMYAQSIRKNQAYLFKLIRFQNYFLTEASVPSSENTDTFAKKINTIHHYGNFIKYSIDSNDEGLMVVNVFYPKGKQAT